MVVVLISPQPSVFQALCQLDFIKIFFFAAGQSYEKRDMKVIKIESGSGSSNKPAVFVDGGIHAREWISPVFVNNMINKVCTGTYHFLYFRLIRVSFVSTCFPQVVLYSCAMFLLFLHRPQCLCKHPILET